MIKTEDFQKAVELINKSSNVLVTTHTKPDGDACGSMVAMADVLTSLGKKVELLLLSEAPKWYEFLFSEPPKVANEDSASKQLIASRFKASDLIIIVDTNSYNQLPRLDQHLKQTDKPVLVIDHHVTSDGLGAVELIDTGAAATALIVFDLLKYANWRTTEKIAHALFVAVATDTGWFQFNNTDNRTHRTCSELIDAGVNPADVYHHLYQNFSYPRFKLMTAMLGTLELHFDGRYAAQHLSQKDFERTGATYNDTENLIDECRRITTVEAAALFIELKDNRIKCSLRSRGAVDVHRIAQKFGGGGHKMAAGLHLPGPLYKAELIVYQQIKEQFAEIDGK